MAAALPVLTFHALDERGGPIAFSPAVFERALERLRARGYRTVRLAEVAGWLRRRQALPERSVAITFDDGYRSVYEVGFPALARHGMTATVFLAVGEGAATGAADRLPPMEGRTMLSWGEIRDLQAGGLDLGAHTRTHPDLTRLAPAHIEAEVVGSKDAIEDALGVPVECFAYPYGAGDEASREIVARHFRCACSTRLGLVTARSDPYALERVETYYLRTDRRFAAIFSPRLGWRLRLLNVPRRVRQAVQRRPGA